MRSAQVLYATITLISLVTVASLSVSYIEFWKCVTNIDLSVSHIEISPIQSEATEVDQVTIDITFDLTNPTSYHELKARNLYYQINLNSKELGRETIFIDTEINPYSNKIIFARIELTDVKGEQLILLKNPSQLVWQVACVLKLDGLLGETRRTFYLSYAA